jgi:hypothetical protein
MEMGPVAIEGAALPKQLSNLELRPLTSDLHQNVEQNGEVQMRVMNYPDEHEASLPMRNDLMRSRTMRKSLAALTCVVLAGIFGQSSPAWAQQKTAKICQEEWRADKVANQAKGITEKAYIAECRTSAAAVRPAAPSPQAATGKKTVKACQEEWRANKATNQATGITEKAYVLQCRAGGTAAQSPPAIPAAQTRAAPSAPAPSAPPVASTVRPAPVTTGSATPAANQFSTEAEAKGRCAADTVVWVNLHSKIYHYAGHKTYGKTKTGAYMCEQDTAAQGMRASKSEKRPG